MLVGGASIGIQVLVPLTWPHLDHVVSFSLLALCILGIAIAATLYFRPQAREHAVVRRWAAVGFGQGWLETRVRNNQGDEILVSCNPGSGADHISMSTQFSRRSRPRRTATVELLFEVDDRPFEWDVADSASATFNLDCKTWRDLQTIKEMIASMRQGKELRVAVPSLDLEASFTLDGAYDALSDAALLGDTN